MSPNMFGPPIKTIPSRMPERSRGRTLIELIIALAIGFVVLGAVMLTSLSTSQSGSANQQLRKLQEDAALASYILNQSLRLAGYSEPRLYPTGRNVIGNYAGPGVVGCDGAFTDAKVDDYTALTCANAPGNAPDTMAVLYEATAENSPTNAAGLPIDCRGFGIFNNTPGAAGATYSRADLRFYIAQDAETGNPALFCAGSGSANGNPRFAGTAIIDNVVDMQITYGVAAVPAPDSALPAKPLFEPIAFMSASEVSAMPAYPVGTVGPDGVWPRVVSARICLLLRSADNALDTPVDYTDCNGTVVPNKDRRAYRLVHVTSAFYNRIPPCADPSAAPGEATAQLDRCDIGRFSPPAAAAP